MLGSMHRNEHKDRVSDVSAVCWAGWFVSGAQHCNKRKDRVSVVSVTCWAGKYVSAAQHCNECVVARGPPGEGVTTTNVLDVKWLKDNMQFESHAIT